MDIHRCPESARYRGRYSSFFQGSGEETEESVGLWRYQLNVPNLRRAEVERCLFQPLQPHRAAARVISRVQVRHEWMVSVVVGNVVLISRGECPKMHPILKFCILWNSRSRNYKSKISYMTTCWQSTFTVGKWCQSPLCWKCFHLAGKRTFRTPPEDDSTPNPNFRAEYEIYNPNSI